MVAAVMVEPKIIMAGLGEPQVLDVENVNIDITAPDEEEDEPPPSFGGHSPAEKQD
jgi:hypothetical protein